jgi:hypothetical protein
MKKPTAEELAIADLTGALHQVRKGTVRVPPPTPTSAEITPINKPMKLVPNQPGKFLLEAGWAPSPICRETINRNTPKNITRNSLDNNLAK